MIPIQLINLGRCFITGIATNVANIDLVEMLFQPFAKQSWVIATP